MKMGDMILVHYTVRTDDGQVVDTTKESVAKEAGVYDPNRVYEEAIVVLGKSSLLKAVEEALLEMNAGEKRDIVAPPEKAYGERREDLVIRVPIKQLQRLNIRPAVGEEIEVGGRRGVITKVTERFAHIDLNHPLAGKSLKIELEVTKVVESPEEKVKVLFARMLRLPLSSISIEVPEEGVFKVSLPQAVLGITDLDARLSRAIADVKEAVGAKRLQIVIDVSLSS